jgi:hypothetical protein
MRSPDSSPPAEPAVGEREHDQAVAVLAAVLRLVDRLRERSDLIMREVPLARLGRLRQLEACRGVRGQALVLDGEAQRPGEHVHDLAHRRRRPRQRRGPLLHAQPREAPDLDGAEFGDDVLVDDVLDPAAGRRPQIASRAEPGLEPVGNGDLGARGVEVAALGDVDLSGRQEQLRGLLGREAALLRLLLIRPAIDRTVAAPLGSLVSLDAAHVRPGSYCRSPARRSTSTRR